MKDNLIKALYTSRFSIELFETHSNKYMVRYENPKNGSYIYSEAVQDYKTAALLFDMKAEELEGN